MTREVLQMALEALENEVSVDISNYAEIGKAAEQMYEVIDAIKEALVQPEQEPCMCGETYRLGVVHRKDTPCFDYIEHVWVGLNGKEVNHFAAGCHLGNAVQDAIRKAEAALKEKNT